MFTGKNKVSHVPTIPCTYVRTCVSSLCIHKQYSLTSRNQAEAAQLIIDAGAQVNSLNGRGTTPLMVAATIGTYAVVKVLIDCPRVDLDARVQELGWGMV